MQDPQDRLPFGEAMRRLSRVLNTIELTNEHLEAYWDALCDLGVDGVSHACQHLARHWQPTYAERFPVPGTIREHVRTYREEQRALRGGQAQGILPQHTETTYEEGKAAIRAILDTLEQRDTTHDTPQPVGPLNPPDPSRWLPLEEADGRPYRRQHRGGLHRLFDTTEEHADGK